MELKYPDEAYMRKEIEKLSKRLERVQQKYEQAKTADRKKTLAFLIEDIKDHIGLELLDCKDYEKALAVYQSMSWDIYGEHKYNGISLALIYMERYDEAKQLLEEGLQRFPKSYFLLMRMGVLYRLQDCHVDALKYFKQAFKNCPSASQAHFFKAASLSELGYYEEALSIVRKLIKEEPDHGSYLVEAGYCTQMMGYPEEAVGYYKKALNCGYVSSGIYAGLTFSYMNMGLKHDALEIAQEGLKEYPEMPCMYIYLSECYLEYDWVDEARSTIEEGLKKFPDDEDLQDALQSIEDETNDPDSNKKPPFLGIMLLLSLILKRNKKKK